MLQAFNFAFEGAQQFCSYHYEENVKYVHWNFAKGTTGYHVLILFAYNLVLVPAFVHHQPKLNYQLIFAAVLKQHLATESSIPLETTRSY